MFVFIEETLLDTRENSVAVCVVVGISFPTPKNCGPVVLAGSAASVTSAMFSIRVFDLGVSTGSAISSGGISLDESALATVVDC